MIASYEISEILCNLQMLSRNQYHSQSNLRTLNYVLAKTLCTRMHSSRMHTACSLRVSPYLIASHAHPLEQPCMPPEQPCMPPRSNHTSPPSPEQPCIPPREQPCMPPKQPCMPPWEQPHMPPKQPCMLPQEQPCMPPQSNHE